MARAKYSWGISCGVLFIIDEHDGSSMSVTNDIENVIKEVCRKAGSIPNKVIYRDTEWVWDQVVCKDGEFVCFKHLGTGSMEGAIDKVLI